MRNIKDFIKDLKSRFGKEATNRRIIEKLTEIGEDGCEHARMNGSYKNRTGTLCSAIKYRVVKDGETVAEGGYMEIGGDEPKTSDPEQLADEALDAMGDGGEGISLILVNGAPYAKHVEDKGYNVMHLTFEEVKERIGKELK